MKKELKLTIHNVIAKPALQCDSELWILKEDKRTEAPEVRFRPQLLCVSVRDKVGSTDVTEQLGTERKVKQIQEYRRKWQGHLDRKPPERFPCKHIFITLWKHETLDFKG
jgi:hypothetical protein